MTDPDNNPDKQPAPMPRPASDPSDLADRIRRAQERYVASTPDAKASSQGDMSGLARGLRIGTEFVAAILVGTGVGYVIDLLAGTRPWAMLGFFMLGFAAGILNVTRVVAELNARSASEASQGTPDDDKTI